MSLESVLKRDRRVVMSMLILTSAIAWLSLLSGAGMSMSAPDPAQASGSTMLMTVMEPAHWTGRYAVLMFLMWCIMMAAMMLPSAAPTLVLVSALHRKARPERAPFGATAFFAAGYLLAWAGFSLFAVAAQWGLSQSSAVASLVHEQGSRLAGALLVLAGLWQLTPFKQACLRQCRSPLSFLMQRWRSGRSASLAMGLEHGFYCLGCCWLLMALLFAGGMMNLYWIVALTGYVAAEKLLAAGTRMVRWVGAALLVIGLVLAAGLA
jgi:predicted metal-binding membrane protein